MKRKEKKKNKTNKKKDERKKKWIRKIKYVGYDDKCLFVVENGKGGL